MFYKLALEHQVFFRQKIFGPNVNETIKMKLVKEVEGTTGKSGFIIAVTEIDAIGHEIRMKGREWVKYPVKFKALVFRPFKGQVVDAIVNEVNKVGIFCDVGPLSCFVSLNHLPPGVEFDPTSTLPSYNNQDETVVIKTGVEIRVRLIGTRVDKKDMFAVGTLADDFLGPCMTE